ncbi:hypothetical protein GCM10027452_07270 [Micromonospora halotolerans]
MTVVREADGSGPDFAGPCRNRRPGTERHCLRSFRASSTASATAGGPSQSHARSPRDGGCA